MKPWSLRLRLTLQAGLVLFLAVSISIAGVAWLNWQEDLKNLDENLRREAAAIVNVLANNNLPPREAERLAHTLLGVEKGRRIAQIDLGDNTIITIPGNSKPLDLFRAGSLKTGRPSFRNTKIDGQLMRIGIFHEKTARVAVAASLEPAVDPVRDLIPWYLGLALILITIIFTGGLSLADRALQPVGEIAQASERITSQDLHQRLPTGQADPEIRRLSAVLNGMLDRLQVSFDSIRRFTADAAHEIKTPLTIIHGQLEAGLRTLKSSPEQEETLLAVLAEVERLNRLVEGLLLLSRSDAGRLELQLQHLDLSEMTADLLNDAAILAAPLQLHVESNIAPGVCISADKNSMRQVLLNLVDNACKYNRPSGLVHVSLAAVSNGARLEIGNNGPAILPDDSARIFQRFHRGDVSRGRPGATTTAWATEGGLGLGLSICQEIVRAHGGQISLVMSEDDWTVFAVEMPPPCE